MDSLRHFTFLDKSSVTIVDKDDKVTRLSSVVGAVGDNRLAYLLQSNGLVVVLQRPQQRSEGSKNILKCHTFKAFDYEASHIVYCSQEHIVIILGRDDESNAVLKFSSFSFKHISNLATESPKLIQSVPVFPRGDSFTPDSIVAVVASSCSTLAVVAIETNGLYIYKNYVVPFGDKRAPCNKFLDLKGFLHVSEVSIRSVVLLKAVDGFIITVCCASSFVSLKVTADQNVSLLFQDSTNAPFDMCCLLPSQNQVAVISHSGSLCFYDAITGLISSIPTSTKCPKFNLVPSRSTTIASHKFYIAMSSSETNLTTVYFSHQGLRFIAFCQHIPNVRLIFQALNSIFITITSGTQNEAIVFQLSDWECNAKVAVLVRKRLFDWAIKIAEIECMGNEQIGLIYKLKGDWLYENEQYGEAVESYCLAGSAVDPCYVIEKYVPLEWKIHLIKFLLHVLRNGAKSLVYTNMLLKLFQHGYTDPDVNSLLTEFIQEFGDRLRDNIAVSIQDCRMSGGYEFARFITSLQKDHIQHVSVLVEDFKAYKEAFDYLKNLDVVFQCPILLQHGRRLMNSVPDTIDLVCQIINSNSDAVNAFIPNFCLNDEFVRKVISLTPQVTSHIVFTSKLNLMLGDINGPGNSVDGQVWKILNGAQNFNLQMIALLQCLYFRHMKGVNAMAIKMGYYHLPLVIAGLSGEGSCSHILDYAMQYGYNEKSVWIGALRLIRDPVIMKEALTHIHNYKLLTYHTVINILKRHRNLKLKHVKEYLKLEFRKIEDEHMESVREIQQDRRESSEMNAEIQNFKHNHIVVSNTKCSRCELNLEYPFLTFYCKHSYHTYCVASDSKCPRCTPRITETRGLVGKRKETEFRDIFYKFLGGSTNPFQYISQEFSRFGVEYD